MHYRLHRQTCFLLFLTYLSAVRFDESTLTRHYNLFFSHAIIDHRVEDICYIPKLTQNIGNNQNYLLFW